MLLHAVYFSKEASSVVLDNGLEYASGIKGTLESLMRLRDLSLALKNSKIDI